MRYLILGAGPSGLTFANRLMQNEIHDFLVLEKEAEAGGLCRSKNVGGFPFDVGGGHFLDVKDKRVLDFLFMFMPRAMWDEYSRDSRIVVNGNIINSPIEANIWQMKIEDQVQYLKAIAIAGCNLGTAMPEKFIDWIYWKLGERIAEDYMIPYNQKMFGDELNELGTYWLNKLPNVSFDETLISCLERKAYGTQPGHAHFLYPKKYGYGELWLKLAENLGNHIEYNVDVNRLDPEKGIVNNKYEADIIINTIPWSEISEIDGVDNKQKNYINSLKYSSIVTEYIDEMLDTEAHWIYYPDPELSYHRILVRHNFCPGSRGYWTETNLTRFKDEGKSNYFINKYAYPLNTIGKQEKIQMILSYMRERNVYGLGRWGEWQHFNSDVVVARALDLADSLIQKYNRR